MSRVMDLGKFIDKNGMWNFRIFVYCIIKKILYKIIENYNIITWLILFCIKEISTHNIETI